MGSMLKPSGDSNHDHARALMLRNDLEGRGIRDPEVLRGMEEIPREQFVPSDQCWHAYADGPLPIGEGQTISQPYIVALMTEVLRVTRDTDVLEVGTGSGYQTAVLARLVRQVYTIEKLPGLSTGAQEVLRRLGISNVEFRIGDGSLGWPEQRTFDRIIITAAVPDFPAPLLSQLVERGLIVAPIGRESMQQLTVAEKYRGKLIARQVCRCRFVKLIGEHGFLA